MPRLLFHFLFIVGENFERNWAVLNRRQQIERKALVIGNAHGAHVRGIGGKALDVRLAVEFQKARLVGAIRKDLDAQVGQGLHEEWAPFIFFLSSNG
jgi:hypothetical protein